MSELKLHTEKPIIDVLAPRQADLVKLMGGEMNVKKEISFAIQAANSNDVLAGCSPSSIAKAVYNVAICGLSLNPTTKLAYIVPKYIKGKWEAILMPSYQGLCHLILMGKAVNKVGAYAVYEGDEFDYSYGFDTQLVHKPKGSRDAQHITHVYAYAVGPNGEKYLEVMDRSEIDGIMMRSDSGKKGSGPWKTDYAEMARKTAIRRLYKYLPKGSNHEVVSEAISLDEQEYPASDSQIGFIESLLQNAVLADGKSGNDERNSIMREISDGISQQRASELIEYLQANQLDPIASGNNYSATDITRKIQTEIPLEGGES